MIAGNTVTLPANGGANYFGIQITGPHAPTSISQNTLSGGLATSLYGILLENVDTGAVEIERNTVTLGTATAGAALYLSAVAAQGGLAVRDNVFSAPINQSACAGFSYGVTSANTSGLFERNRFFAPSAGSPIAAAFNGAGQVELYESFLWAGRTWAGSNCGSPATGLVITAGTGALAFYATGNTIVGDGDVGYSSCGINTVETPQLFMSSNLVSGGDTANALILAGPNGSTGPQYKGGSFSHNYFYLPNATQTLQTTDFVTAVARGTDAGVPDTNGNIFALKGCFDLMQLPPYYKLAASSACINRGINGSRVDTTPITVDIDGSMRQLGSAPGCRLQREAVGGLFRARPSCLETYRTARALPSRSLA